MSAHIRAARRILGYAGVPAREVAAILRVDVAAVRNDRRALGQDPEVGGPVGYPGGSVASRHESFETYDRLMRSNRGVGL